jgi:predicted P-loop ATPase
MSTYQSNDFLECGVESDNSEQTNIHAIKNYLLYIEPSDLHTIIIMGRAIHFETKGSLEGFNEWHIWSQNSPEYVGENDCDRKWLMYKNHISNEPMCMATIVHFYLKALVKRGQFEVEDNLDYDQKKNIVKSIKNALVIILYDGRLGDIQFDEMKFNELLNCQQITDYTILRILVKIDGFYRVPFSKNIIMDAVKLAGQLDRINPVQDYLYSLSWDGVSRLDEFFINHAESNDTEYTRIVSSKTLIAAVARVFEPGCKVDTTLVLEGAQGCGKSTLIKSLSPNSNWFSDTELPIGNKDAYQQLQGVWLYEIGEMSSVANANKNTLKGFLSASTDKFRLPYGAKVIDSSRRNIFIGTTNDDQYLNDDSGGRRFWPLKVGNIDTQGIINIRDQLWAEATYRYFHEEPWHLSKEQEKLAMDEQSRRYQHDEWEDEIRLWLEQNEFCEVTGKDIFLSVFNLNISMFDRLTQRRISSIMKRLGWERKTISMKGKKVTGYRKT